MAGGLQGVQLNIDGVYLGTVCCESKDMVQWSSSLQVRAFTIPLRCFMAVADIYIHGATASLVREIECQPSIWYMGHAPFFNWIQFKWSNPQNLVWQKCLPGKHADVSFTFTRGSSQTHLSSSCGAEDVFSRTRECGGNEPKTVWNSCCFLVKMGRLRRPTLAERSA